MIQPDNYYDAKHDQEIAQPNSFEALSWLEDAECVFRTFGGNGIRKGYSGKRAIDFVRRFYALGARRVTAVGVERTQAVWVRHEAIKRGLPETDLIEATDRIIVELPNEPKERVALIEQWINTFGRRKWDVPVDTGQRYLLFWWD